MAGGDLKFRHLGRKTSHRLALLRNLVTSLIEHESISTTWPKAKEAQRWADKLITLAKKNTDKSRRTAEGMMFTSHAHLPKVFTTLRERYLTRPGGYTRVLRIESLNRKHDQAPSAILELVDGPKDMRFAMTARTIMRERAAGDDQPPSNNNNTTNTPPRRRDAPLGAIRDFTAMNIRKVTRFRPDGLDALEREVARLERLAKEQEKKDRDKEKREKETETRESREKGKLAERNVI